MENAQQLEKFTSKIKTVEEKKKDLQLTYKYMQNVDIILIFMLHKSYSIFKCSLAECKKRHMQWQFLMFSS